MSDEKKKVIVWGYGKYYQYKKSYLQRFYNIIGIIGRDIKEQEIDGYPVIAKEWLLTGNYDEIIIMSDLYMFEILKEILALGISTEKIELGVNLPPATGEEVQYISQEEKMTVRDDGVILWNGMKEVNCREDIELLKKLHVGSMSENTIRELPIKPLSYNYGHTRGYSIARYYIDSFVREHIEDIKGSVLEIGDARYSVLGGSAVKKQQILVLEGETGGNYIKGNLETGEGIQNESIDCFILTNVFSCLFDVKKAIHYVGKCLRNGGKAIITVPGIAALSRADNETYGQFWRFTPLGFRRLLEENIPEASISITEYGNVKASAAFLYGLTIEDLTQEELAYHDSSYPLVIGAYVEK